MKRGTSELTGAPNSCEKVRRRVKAVTEGTRVRQAGSLKAGRAGGQGALKGAFRERAYDPREPDRFKGRFTCHAGW